MVEGQVLQVVHTVSLVAEQGADAYSLAPHLLQSLQTASATSEQGAVFRPGVDDLCQWFTAEEVLAIATLAYEQEGLEDSIPTELVAVTDGEEEGPGCEWTVPGTPPDGGGPTSPSPCMTRPKGSLQTGLRSSTG